MKKIILGVTGSIAAYKAVEIVSLLKKKDYTVKVILTRNATKFVSPLTFEAISGEKVIVGQFNDTNISKIEHISLAREADIFVVAPASLNTIGKFANGIADSFLTSLFFAFKGKTLIAPAMNTNMYDNPVNKKNMDFLKSTGIKFISPDAGDLACGEKGPGRLPEPLTIVERIEYELENKILKGKNILISGGPTREKIDDFRFISNPSSGKTGFELASVSRNFGAKTCLVTGKNFLKTPWGIEYIEVETADNMLKEMQKRANKCDILIMSAAVADFKPEKYYKGKIKKDNFKNNIKLKRTPDILKQLSENKKEKQIFVGFSAESDFNRIKAFKKLEKKNLDIIILNIISEKGIGFESDKNKAVILFRDGEYFETDIITKNKLAKIILKNIYKKWIQRI